MPVIDALPASIVHFVYSATLKFNFHLSQSPAHATHHPRNLSPFTLPTLFFTQSMPMPRGHMLCDSFDCALGPMGQLPVFRNTRAIASFGSCDRLPETSQTNFKVFDGQRYAVNVDWPACNGS